MMMMMMMMICVVLLCYFQGHPVLDYPLLKRLPPQTQTRTRNIKKSTPRPWPGRTMTMPTPGGRPLKHSSREPLLSLIY